MINSSTNTSKDTSMCEHGINVGHCNVYHLYNKLHDVCMLLNDVQPLHLLGISETRLNPNHDDNSIQIPNYSIFRKDAKLPGETGMAMYIHQSIAPFTTRRADLESNRVECLWVDIRPSMSHALTVGFIYRNPASTYSWFDDFVHMMDLVNAKSSNVLLLGDFNLDLLKSHPAWESTYSLFGLSQLIKCPTRVTPTSATLLDHIYTNINNRIINPRLSTISLSDHSPVMCTWSCKLPKVKGKGHTTIEYRSFKNFDKDSFLMDLHVADFSQIYQCDDPNNALTVWYDIFKNIVDKHAPVRRKRVKHAVMPKWLTPEIIQAMKDRDRLKKHKQFDEYKKKRNTISTMVKEAKKSYFSNIIENDCEISTIWRAMNDITGKIKKTKTDSSIQCSADDFNRHFLNIADSVLNSSSGETKTNYSMSANLVQFCNEKLGPNDTFQIPCVSVHEVGKYITDLSNKKSTGSDGISSFLLKLSLPYIVEPLTFIYNLCIDKAIFPDSLKLAKVVPLAKSKDISDPNNFRPISLLSVVSKPLERHVQKHLLKFLEDHNLFYPFQSGFRHKHSCQSALIRLCDSLLSSINNDEVCGAVFLDFKKAFDLVNHSILLQKLALYVRHTPTIDFFQSYLDKRKQRVLVNGCYSQEGTVKCGVPQGSILGPILFGIFINDLPFNITNNTVSCDMFADDNSLHTSAKDIPTVQNALQESLNDVSHWCQNNQMVLHPKKTKSMTITTRQKRQRNNFKMSLYLENTPIEQVSEHRVLGVTIDEEFRWHKHINNVCKTVSRNLFLLSQLKHYVESDARKLFFDAHVLSHINYSSVIWRGASEICMKKLNSLHRRAIKLVSSEKDSTTEEKMHNLNILPLHKQFLYNLAVLTFKTIKGSSPPYLRKLLRKASSRYNSSNYLLPRPRVDIYKTSFTFSAPSIWNSLPLNCRKLTSVSCFKKHVHKFFTSSSSI